MGAFQSGGTDNLMTKAVQGRLQPMPTSVAVQPTANPAPMTAPAFSSPTPGGKGGSITTPVTSGQPQMGVPNQYANTLQSGDNTTTQQSPMPQGKGGAVSGATPRGKGI
jgi:hypothetical protein